MGDEVNERDKQRDGIERERERKPTEKNKKCVRVCGCTYLYMCRYICIDISKRL